MKLKRSTLLNKISSIIKWFFIKIWYFKSFLSSSPFFIGGKVKIFIENGKIQIGSKARISDYCEIQSRNGEIKIGNNFNLNSFSRIIAFNEIIIGHNVTIAQFVSILDHDHDYTVLHGNLLLNGYKIKSIRIGSNVWIGDKVCITKGVSIGDNVIIGAGTIVTKDIASNSIVAGNPLRLIKNI